MRRRLVIAFVALAVMLLLLYGLPRAFLRVHQIEEREQEQVDQSALLLSALVSAEQRSGDTVTEEALQAGLRPGERVEYVAPDGSVVAAGDPADREVGVEATAPVAGGGSLTVDYAQDAIDERVRDAILPLLLIGVLLMAFAGLATLGLARRLARPFQDLAGHARALGSGRFDLDIPRYDLPEADDVGQALLTSARSLDLLVQREREFAVNASHELRTPLTAARLRLEDLALWETTPPEIAEELGEVLHELNRLDTAVAALLERDRGERAAAAGDVDLTRIVAAAADRWRARLEQQRRELLLDLEPDLRVRLSEATVTEILDALLDHALQHGEGRVTLAASRSTDYLEVRVADQSRRTDDTEALHATGDAALPRAARLAAAVGGHLAAGSGPSSSFVLTLPPPAQGPV